MAVSEDKIKEIQGSIRRHFNNFIIKTVGRDEISDEDLRELEKLGYDISHDEDYVKDAYSAGKTRSNNQVFDNISHEEFKFKPKPYLTERDQEAIKHFKALNAQYIQKMRMNIETAVENIIRDKNFEYKNFVMDEKALPIFEAGIEKNKRLEEIARELRDEFQDYSRDYQRIVRTTISDSISHGAANAMRDRNKDKGTDEIYVYKVVVKDAALCDFCRRFYLNPDGTPKIYKLSELVANGTNYGKKQSMWLPVLGVTHPNSIFDPKTSIYTQKGWKQIKDIEKGEYVLTHKGRFRKVISVLKEYPNPHKILYEIYYKYSPKDNKNPEGIRKLSLTGDHKILTQRGWIEVYKLKKEDKIIKLLKSCEICNKKMDIGRRDNRTCSSKCMYKLPSDLSGIHGKNKKKIYKKISQTVRNKWKQGYYKKTLECLKSEEHKEKNRNYMLNGGALKALRGNLKTSKPQKELFEMVLKEYPTAKLEYEFLNKSLDIAIPELKVDIEYDGSYWHSKLERKKTDKERDKLLRDNGWHILRYKELPTKKLLHKDISRILQNSNHTFSFEEISIEWIHKIYAAKTHKLYDIAVEEDESFVARGIVVHNCRDHLVEIPKGFGFDEHGHITFIGPEHNEYNKQKGLKKSLVKGRKPYPVGTIHGKYKKVKDNRWELISGKKEIKSRKEIENKIQSVADKYLESKNVPKIKIKFKDKAHSGGESAYYATYRIVGGKKNFPKYIEIGDFATLYKYPDEFLDILGHEIAHHIVNTQSDSLRHNVKFEKISDKVISELKGLWNVKDSSQKYIDKLKYWEDEKNKKELIEIHGKENYEKEIKIMESKIVKARLKTNSTKLNKNNKNITEVYNENKRAVKRIAREAKSN